MFSGLQFVDFQNKMLRSRVSLLTWNAIVAFSEQCVAKLVHGVATLLSS